jgi:hypothetical protein
MDLEVAHAVKAAMSWCISGMIWYEFVDASGFFHAKV